MNTVVGIGVPSTIKLSSALIHFEAFGDVIKGSMDAKRRQKCDVINIFVTYADNISAKRAIKAGFLIIDGERIKIEEENSRKRKLEGNQDSNKDIGRFKIQSKIVQITSKSRMDKDNKHNNSNKTNSHETRKRDRERSPAIHSFIRREIKQKQK